MAGTHGDCCGDCCADECNSIAVCAVYCAACSAPDLLIIDFFIASADLHSNFIARLTSLAELPPLKPPPIS